MMISMKRINLIGSALKVQALLGLSTRALSPRGIGLALLAMLLVGMAFWSTPADAGEPAEPVWSADMTVVEYSSVSIGAASADLFSNVGGSGNLQIKSLWSHIPGRDLRLAFQEGVPNASDYTLQVGGLSLEFPADSSGDSSFKWNDVDVDWEDGQLIRVRIVPTAESDAQPANTPATGVPAISGTAQVGETLAADTSGIADADGLSDVSYAYQWIRTDGGTDTDIAGATDSTYTLTNDDQGKTIKLKVWLIDDNGNSETLTSAATAAVASRPNTPATGLPTISGTVQVDQTLTADTSGITDADGLSDVSYAYRWIRTDGGAGAYIAGATDSTYTLTDDDEGKTIKVRVSFTDDAGNEETLTSAATAAVASRPNSPATGAPTISGTVQVDETLTADTSGITDADGLSDVSYSYQWIRNYGTNDSDIGGQTGSTYTLVSADEGKTIKVRVSFTDDADNEETLTSAATAAVAAAPSRLTVSLENGATTHDGSAVFTFEIRFSEEFALSYTTLRFHAFDVTGGEVLNSQRMDKPSNIRWLITVGPDVNGDVTVVLPVTEDCAAQGAICTEDGRPLSNRLQMTVTGPLSADQNTPATGLPTISGTAQVDETLTADTSGISDADGLDNAEFSYQWIRTDGGTDDDIAGATESTYTLTDDDEGKTIKLKVWFIDDKGNSETLTSAATADVGEPQFLVSNLGAGVSGAGGIQRTLYTARSGFAQAFTTGAKTGGYPLGSVGIQVSHFYDGSTVGDHLQVTINGVASEGEPGDAHCTLTNPSSFSTPGVSAFEAPTGAGSCAQLATETTYFVVIEWVDPSGTDHFALIPQTYPTEESAATEEDPGGAEGWSIADQSYYLTVSSNDWTWTAYDQTASFKIVVKEAAVTAAEANSPATGAPTISGTAQVGETLTADTSPIADVDGLTNVSYSYQWLAEGSDIAGATSSSYTLTSSQQGQTVQVRVSFTDDAANQESLTSAETLAVAARPNTAATGEPTISGTPQVEQTLTADTSAISDEDGLDNVSYQYQWLRDDAYIAGQTSSTYELVSADEGKTIRVRMTFTDDAGNAESLTSTATTPIAAQPAETPVDLLTASFANMPADHNGENFTFQLSFSENVEAGYARIRDHALTVTGGSIASASRITQGSTQGWNVEVDPTGNEAVTITLPETTDCNAARAICTDDERMLSHTTSVRVAGPPAISVSDANVQEAEGAVLEFSVTLSHASSRTVTVDYATSDGTAQAGSDYTAASGALTFNAGDTSQTVQVTVLTDSDDEGQETITLTLSNPSQATLDDATGTGAIENGESSSGTQEDPPAEDPPVETPAVLLTASFANMPADHNGENFTIQLSFSENVNAGYARIRDDAFTVSGGTIDSASRITQGSNQGWNVEVNPTGNGPVTITLPETTDCDASGAICTDDSRKLSQSTSATVAGPPAVSVSDATVQEAEGAVLVFTASLSHASSRTVTVDYDTSDGTAVAGSDYTAASATLTFNAGETSQTVEVTVLTDQEDESQETLTLTLSNPSQATLGDGTGTGAIENGESSSETQEDPPAETPAVLLTASFDNMPATHNGSAFTFDLSFSENVKAGYERIRDDAFTISGGDITSAVRKEQGSNQGWTITVQPDGNGTISITLPETTDCNATGAICTDDERKLSHTNVAAIAGPG